MTEREPFETVLHLAEYLGIELYDWQAKICLSVDQIGTGRGKIAVATPNGAGKSSRIIPLCCIRHLERWPSGKVIVTSLDAKQIADQVWPAIRLYARRFPGWRILEGDKRVETRQGGRLRAYTTDDPGRAEGAHQGPDSPLLYIVDEAKSIDPVILQAVDRCTYNCLMYVSSPGGKRGPFYDAFTSNRARWQCFRAGLADCKHLSDERIKDLTASYPENDPFVRSTLHGEFMDTDLGVVNIFELTELERWMTSQIGIIHGPTVIACDFAGSEGYNVAFKRVGNRFFPPVAWKETNTSSAVGRFNEVIRRLGYDDHKHDHVYVIGDSTGIGQAFCDRLRECGIDIRPINFGSKASIPRYKNMASQMWHEAAEMVKSDRIVPPPMSQPFTRELLAQLSSRRLKYESNGKAWMETKEEMRARGIPSPDIGDAFCMAFGCTIPTAASWLPYDDVERQRIARKHGWDYTPDEPEGRERNDDDTTGFGGVHSIW